jgi:hypothetical protein
MHGPTQLYYCVGLFALLIQIMLDILLKMYYNYRKDLTVICTGVILCECTILFIKSATAVS